MSSTQCPNEACRAIVEGEDQRHCPKCGSFLSVSKPDPTDELLGQAILGGKYRILSIIGEGGMGKVYLADQKLGTATRKVAIKTLQPDLAGDPQIVARFHRETQTVIELEHPNTIKFYDFGELAEHGKKLFVVMEYIQGESLAHTIARGAIDGTRTERIVGQVCGSLQEAHEKGIVHRDLKPDNIILTQKGSKGDFVKVLDFGIAKRSEAEDKESAKLTRQGMVLGTPPYMSPEQFTGQALDNRSDIYALAIIAYEMLTGVLPYTAATPWEWATKHLTAQPTPIEMQPNGGRLPERYRRSIMRALDKDRERRHKTVSEFLQEFTGNSEGSGDWTSGSTSLPNRAQPTQQTPPIGSYGNQTPSPFGPPAVPSSMGSGGYPPQQSGYPTPPGGASGPGAFYPTAIGAPQGMHTPAPSSAGFAAVPPAVGAGQAGSNPSFPQPMTGYMPMAAPPSARRGGKGLIIGIVLGVVVLGGVGFAVSQMGDDENTNTPAANTGTQMQTPSPTPDPNAVNNAQGGGGAPANNGVPTPQPPPDPHAAGNQGTNPAPDPNAVPPPQLDPHAGEPDPNAAPGAGATQASADAGATAAATPTPTPAPDPTPDPPAGGGGGGPSAGDIANSRVAAIISRGQSAASRGDFPSAVAALIEASNNEPTASSVRSLRGDLRRRGRNQINNQILSGDCSSAQQLYRQLRAANAAPPADSFGEACPAP